MAVALEVMMRLDFFRHRIPSGDVFPRAEASGPIAQLANCLEAVFHHPTTARALLSAAEAAAEGVLPPDDIGSDVFSVRIGSDVVTVEFILDERWPEPLRIDLRDFVAIARAWYAFVSSTEERGTWASADE